MGGLGPWSLRHSMKIKKNKRRIINTENWISSNIESSTFQLARFSSENTPISFHKNNTWQVAQQYTGKYWLPYLVWHFFVNFCLYFLFLPVSKYSEGDPCYRKQPNHQNVFTVDNVNSRECILVPMMATRSPVVANWGTTQCISGGSWLASEQKTKIKSKIKKNSSN